ELVLLRTEAAQLSDEASAERQQRQLVQEELRLAIVEANHFRDECARNLFSQLGEEVVQQDAPDERDVARRDGERLLASPQVKHEQELQDLQEEARLLRTEAVEREKDVIYKDK
ncbi:unnamed protein product, partial [Symbiodinium pilosum]